MRPRLHRPDRAVAIKLGLHFSGALSTVAELTVRVHALLVGQALASAVVIGAVRHLVMRGHRLLGRRMRLALQIVLQLLARLLRKLFD